tara:strand:- start:679 stop:1107 length:429 start_codon:yes stop_codon:yes gene_type:complete
MALDGGGGGGGGPVGSANTFTGTAEALEIMGNHIYGYSGLVGVDNNETDLINTTTGSYYCKVTMMFSYATDEPQGDDMIFRVRLNEGIIWQLLVPHSEAHYSQPANQHIVIPPYTQLRCTGQNDDNSNVHNNLVIVAGRIYR